MARHRNVRNQKFDDDYEGYNDVYGHSLEDDYGVSPGASQYLYDRSRPQHQLSNFVSTEKDIIEEEHEVEVEPMAMGAEGGQVERTRQRLDSLTIETAVSRLGADEEMRMQYCLDTIRNVVGDSVTESVMKAHIIQAKFNGEKALDDILNEVPLQAAAVLPQDMWKKPKKEEPKQVIQPKEAESRPSTSRPNNGKIKSQEQVKVIPAAKGAVTMGFNVATKDGSSSPNPLLQVDKKVVKCPSPIITRDRREDKKVKVFKGDVAVEEYKKERGGGKDLLNLLVIGHVDAGKSTLMGHVLYQLGQVPKKTMHKFEQESKKIGKQSFVFAWVLDETGEERSRGITMDVGQSRFETEHKSIILLDAPGHKDFIPNMITGAAQADVAILVVDSTNGEFETGFESGGQTREHAFLVRSLGVNQLIVAVNKLDNADWSQERFEDIRVKLTYFLTKHASFRESDLTYIPCSGLIGENLSKKATEPKLTSWYKNGPSLVDAIDALRPPERPVAKPLRITVSDVFKGTGGLCVSGRVVTGMVQPGAKILIQPVNEVVNVKSIQLDEGIGTTTAFAGDSVLLSVQGYSDINVVSMGCILSDPNFPCKLASAFRAQIVTFDVMTVPLIKGFTGVLHIGTSSEQATIKRIISHLNKGTGEVLKSKPRCLPKNASGVIEVETARPICLEEFKDVKELGRFTLRSSGVTFAAGVITHIL